MERKIIIGLITHTEYLKRVRPEVDVRLFESQIARLLSEWSLKYFDQYGIAVGSNIESLYFNEIKKNKHRVSKEIAQEIEEDILPSLSEEYLQTGIHLESLVKDTITFCNERRLVLLKDGIETAVDKGDLTMAENLISAHKVTVEAEDVVRFNTPEALEQVIAAYEQQGEQLLYYPGALGEFWNHNMVRGGFVAFLAPEKRGKTWLLLDAAVRAAKQKRKVVFVQCGDMTRNQQLRRMGTYLTGVPADEKYTGKQYTPVKDCALNQLNMCDKAIRECDFGVFEDRGWDEKTLRREITFDDLVEALQHEKEYKPCHNCKEYTQRNIGAVWLKEQHIDDTITEAEMSQAIYKTFIAPGRDLRMLTYPNDSLSVDKLKQVLNSWELQDGFKPDVVVLDYADLLVADTKNEFRHQQNQIWKQLRGLNQKLDCLLLTATQSDADSYERDTLSLKNFSEDKRKFAHVTAMYGLNQDHKGREKKMKLLRINELIMREGDFDSNRQVHVLQALCYGKPLISSFF